MRAPRVTTCDEAGMALARLCDEVASTRQPMLIRRPGGEDVVLISAEELASLTETAHLMRSPANAQRLLRALLRAQEHALPPSTVGELRRELDLAEE